MAIHAIDFHSIRDFAVDVTIAVRVLRKVTVHAVHALLGMDVVHVYGFGFVGAIKLFRVFAIDNLIVCVE